MRLSFGISGTPALRRRIRMSAAERYEAFLRHTRCSATPTAPTRRPAEAMVIGASASSEADNKAVEAPQAARHRGSRVLGGRHPSKYDASRARRRRRLRVGPLAVVRARAVGRRRLQLVRKREAAGTTSAISATAVASAAAGAAPHMGGPVRAATSSSVRRRTASYWSMPSSSMRRGRTGSASNRASSSREEARHARMCRHAALFAIPLVRLRLLQLVEDERPIAGPGTG